MDDELNLRDRIFDLSKRGLKASGDGQKNCNVTWWFYCKQAADHYNTHGNFCGLYDDEPFRRWLYKAYKDSTTNDRLSHYQIMSLNALAEHNISQNIKDAKPKPADKRVQRAVALRYGFLKAVAKGDKLCPLEMADYTRIWGQLRSDYRQGRLPKSSAEQLGITPENAFSDLE